MNRSRHNLTLDQAVLYNIKVPGYIGESWADWFDGITINVEGGNDDSPVTVLTGTLDQAALQGLLHRLYTLGVPLISVICMDVSNET
jgi:hypothetical protein